VVAFCVLLPWLYSYTVKYAFVQNAQYKVKYQSRFLPTHEGFQAVWSGYLIKYQDGATAPTVTHPSTNRSGLPISVY